MLDWLDEKWGNVVDTFDNHPEHIIKWVWLLGVYGFITFLCFMEGIAAGALALASWGVFILGVVIFASLEYLISVDRVAEKHIIHLRKCVVDDQCAVKDSKLHVLEDKVEWFLVRHVQKIPILVLGLLILRLWLEMMLVLPLFEKPRATAQ